ncbi:transposase [Streptomyces sp. Ncost-T10-10d]|uniref:transposase n=1 Tax=Streptomyces sp. Ncost-T10-10d TaxID=1839774 RepID=UPI00272E1D84|nr:transposase [Streptomyces sp. Ncost-T10-10d]
MLPEGKKPGHPPVWTRRQLIDGIRFRTRTGVPWRDVSERYGPWGRVYDLFRHWSCRSGWVCHEAPEPMMPMAIVADFRRRSARDDHAR